MNEIEYLRSQLDLIIGFLDVSDEKVFEVIKSHDRFGSGSTIGDLYENSYPNFQNHVTTSSLILGFTHFEDFLTKMAGKLLFQHPTKNKMKIDISRLESLGSNYRQVLANEQAKSLTFDEKIKLVQATFANFDATLIAEISFVNKIRNCLMHNNGFADKRLEQEYPNGCKIILSSWEINGYGLNARRFADELWRLLDN